LTPHLHLSITTSPKLKDYTSKPKFALPLYNKKRI